MQHLLDLEQKFANVDSTNFQLNGFRIKGYASVFNVVDNHNDLINKGAFQDSIKRHTEEGRIKFLWQHSHVEPIGVIEELYEDEVGLYLKASINNNTQLGKEVISLIHQKAINGLSIGFKVTDFEYEASGVRIIKKLELWEISIVTFPANEHAQISSFENTQKSLIDTNFIFNKALNAITKLNS
jgi:uncharacterized protein